MFRENYGAPRFPEFINYFFQVWENSETATSKCGGSRIQKEVLHINHEKSGSLLIKTHYVFVEWINLF